MTPRREQPSRHQGISLLVAGLLLLVGVPVAWWLTAPEPAGQTVTSVNADAAVALAEHPASSSQTSADATSETSAATPSQSPEPVGSSSGAPAPAPVPESTADPGTAAQPSDPPVAAAPVPAVPVRIYIPDLGVDTSVVSVGVDGDGELEIPSDVHTVGWYRFGALPGAAGSAVLTGHVDSADQGPGAFARLGDLNPGQQFAIVDETGTQFWFAVVAREQWPKGEVPMDRLFDQGGEPRVVLLTCGGAFDRSVRGYKDNIAVTATPVG